jgi:hypothetical protein
VDITDEMRAVSKQSEERKGPLQRRRIPASARRAFPDCPGRHIVGAK